MTSCFSVNGKKFAAECEEISHDIKHDFKDFCETFERDLRKELRKMKSNMSFINQAKT